MITFCEAYAGTGAVSLSMFGLSPFPLRTGHKRRIANIITDKMGITKHNVEKIVFCELDPHIRLLLKSYTDKDLHNCTKDTLWSYMGMYREDPLGLWLDCVDIVKNERITGNLDDFSLANWFISAIWSMSQGCYSFGYCGPGKVTKSGNSPGLIQLDRSIPRLPFIGNEIEIEILDSCNKAYGDIIYLDPPYNINGNDNLYGSSKYGENSNVSTACELAEKLMKKSRVYISTSDQIYTGQSVIAILNKRGKDREEWFGIVD